MNRKIVNIGMFGLGTVGTGVARILKSQASAIEKKTGIRFVLRKVCVRSGGKRRTVRLPRGVLTTRPAEILQDPAVDIVIELMGGIHPAKDIILRALAAGKHVVTANKALLAEEGKVIFREAARASRQIGFEASVCAGIPIVRSMQEGLCADNISHVMGIVNGTCNFILTAMSKRGLSFKDALREAQRKGFAEKNPKLDIEGADSAHKLALLARLAFGADSAFRSIHVEGIQSLSETDVEYARELGYRMKLLAIGKKMPGGLELRVHPTLLPADHPLSGVEGVYNAVFVHAEHAGDLLFYGQGAGMFPTASAVVSDVLGIAQNSFSFPEGRSSVAAPKRMPMADVISKYYLRFQVADKPGVLGRIAQILGKNHISILSVHQKESHDARSVPVLVLTYEAREKNIKAALQRIDALKEVNRKTVVLRVET